MEPTNIIDFYTTLPIEAIRAVCKEYPVRELSLFGSVLTPGYGKQSDVDFLVEFDTGATVGFLLLAELQERLAAAVSRPVDLVPKLGLKPSIRGEVLKAARIIYAK